MNGISRYNIVFQISVPTISPTYRHMYGLWRTPKTRYLLNSMGYQWLLVLLNKPLKMNLVTILLQVTSGSLSNQVLQWCVDLMFCFCAYLSKAFPWNRLHKLNMAVSSQVALSRLISDFPSCLHVSTKFLAHIAFPVPDTPQVSWRSKTNTNDT